MVSRYKEQVSFFRGNSSAQLAKRRRTDEVRNKLDLIPTDHLFPVFLITLLMYSQDRLSFRESVLEDMSQQ